jgi:uncharacterized protein YndB with AHSA1/START domain
MAAGRKGEPIPLNRTSLERTSGTEIVITRTFPAPAQIVFDAWTKPEYVSRWWAPLSRGVTLAQCEADRRPGGTYRYVLARGAAERFAFFGRYLEIARPTRLVYTQCFEPMPDGEAVVTVTFEERDGATTLMAHEVYPSKAVLDGVLASGMEDGMRETFEQLDALVASLRG